MRDDYKPSISLWDFRAAEKHLRALGAETVDEDAIFAAYEDLDRLVESEKKTTKKTRRTKQRRKLHAPAQSQPKPGLSVVNDNASAVEPGGRFELDEDDLKPQWEDLS